MSEGEESSIKSCESFRFFSLRSLEIFATALFADAANSVQMNSPSSSVQLIICDYVYCID